MGRHGIGKRLVKNVLPCWMFLACLSPAPAPAENALLLPRAGQSLLLDAGRAGERLFAAGEHGHILYSDDHGQSWVQAQVPTRQMLTAIHFPSPRRGWAVGHDGLILVSVDAGEHWALQRDGLVDQQWLNRERLHNAVRDRAHTEEALLAAATVGERARLRERLEELELQVLDAEDALAEPVHAPPLLDVFFLDELRGFAIGAFNTLLQTTDGGVSWQLRSRELDNPREYHLYAITGSPDGRLWIAAEGGLLFASADSGATWESLASPYDGSFFGIIRSPASDALLVFGLRGNIFRSEDGGSVWRAVPVASDRSLAGGWFVNSDYVLLVGAVGTLLVSDDGGRSFQVRLVAGQNSLSAVTSIGDTGVAVGQGGLHLVSPFGDAR